MGRDELIEQYINQNFEIYKDFAGGGAFGSWAAVQHKVTKEKAILKKSGTEKEHKEHELKYIK